MNWILVMWTLTAQNQAAADGSKWVGQIPGFTALDECQKIADLISGSGTKKVKAVCIPEKRAESHGTGFIYPGAILTPTGAP